MEVDGRTLDADRTLEADIAIIGAGPAGLVLASTLSRAGFTVLLVESGGRAEDPDQQRLNEGTQSGDPYAGLGLTRARCLGGSSALWNTPVGNQPGAKYAPLDASDFRSGGPGPSGWPLSFADLEPYYRRAQEVTGLGPFRYEGNDWFQPRPDRADQGLISTRVYQLGTAQWCRTDLPRALLADDRVTVCTSSTVTGLITNPSGDTVIAADAVTQTQRRLRLEARTFVAAGGAVENARLLLVAGLGNTHDWVGRCFMEHPRDRSLWLVPEADAFEQLQPFDVRVAADGTRVMGRIAVDAGAGGGAMINGSASLFPRRRRGLVAQWIGRLSGSPVSAGPGWSNATEPGRPFEGFDVLVNAEQRPHPDNRITLGTDRDALGILRPHLHWAWRQEDGTALEHLKGIIVQGIEGNRWGRVERKGSGPPDPNAHHHAGTTRMAAEARDGVVDPDGRVFGVANLYLAGASVFPRAGFANPTLTIVALAIRLAGHLAQGR